MSPEKSANKKAKPGKSSGIQSAGRITRHWLLFAHDKSTLDEYFRLGEEAIDRLKSGGKPKKEEELYAPYLKAIGKMTGYEKVKKRW